MKFKILSGILVFCCIAAGIYFLTGRVNKRFPITTPKQAVAYAKTDFEVKEFIVKWTMKGHKVNAWAKFEKNENIWIGVFFPEGTRDLSFEIKFRPDGTILHKGYGMGG